MIVTASHASLHLHEITYGLSRLACKHVCFTALHTEVSVRSSDLPDKIYQSATYPLSNRGCQRRGPHSVPVHPPSHLDSFTKVCDGLRSLLLLQGLSSRMGMGDSLLDGLQFVSILLLALLARRETIDQGMMRDVTYQRYVILFGGVKLAMLRM